jgi:hypothetical protein
LGIERFNLEAGIRAAHVPAQPGDAIADVIANAVAGRTTYMMAPIPLALADRVLAAPDVLKQLAKHDADPLSMTQPQFARFILDENESAARIIQAAGIKPQ